MRGACLLALMLLTTAGIGVVIKRLYWSSFDYNFKMHMYYECTLQSELLVDVLKMFLPMGPKVAFIYTFWYSLSSTSSILE